MDIGKETESSLAYAKVEENKESKRRTRYKEQRRETDFDEFESGRKHRIVRRRTGAHDSRRSGGLQPKRRLKGAEDRELVLNEIADNDLARLNVDADASRIGKLWHE
jgi:hypothetical protein